jgi:hypothetical protein
LAALVAAHEAATGELRRRAEAAEALASSAATALAAAEGRERDALARVAEAGEARLVEAAELGALWAEVVRLAADLEEARAPWWRRWVTQ